MEIKILQNLNWNDLTEDIMKMDINKENNDEPPSMGSNADTFEQKREHVASGVECYMKQYGVSVEEEVYTLFQNEIADAWKDINQEFLKLTAVSMPLLERVLNLAHAMDVIYKEDDGYTNAHLIKDYVASLIINPLVI
uniref:Terpene synthase metal-binding domain-containing protein n=1 Tax=Fagus sylvatica TaxID=28930 RepID=A0A2N9FPG5_FAGSY